MTLITFDNGGPVFTDGKIGTGQGCCCGQNNCCQVSFFVYSGICPGDPSDDPATDFLCLLYQDLYDWLAGVFGSLGYTVSQDSWAPCLNENYCQNYWGNTPCLCSWSLAGSANCCGLPNPELTPEELFGVNPNWVNLSSYYDGDLEFLRNAALNWSWVFSCDQYLQPQFFEYDGLLGYWVPSCNPLP